MEYSKRVADNQDGYALEQGEKNVGHLCRSTRERRCDRTRYLSQNVNLVGDPIALSRPGSTSSCVAPVAVTGDLMGRFQAWAR